MATPAASPRYAALRRKAGDNLLAYVFMAAGIICFAVFSWYPLVRGVVLSFQHPRFVLAECRTEVAVTRAFVEQCLRRLVAGTLSGEEAAMAKWWCSELQGRVIDRCLQLFGGYGYMLEYPIARAYADARVTRIYGGANEIMKEIIGRSMGLGDR